MALKKDGLAGDFGHDQFVYFLKTKLVLSTKIDRFNKNLYLFE